MTDRLAPPVDAELRALLERTLSSSYELDREIGRGGMGVVYRARDRRLKRQVAIKLLPPELAFRGEIKKRFLREAETAAQLSHPNIVPIYSVDERDGLVYFVMALVEGENLALRMQRRGPILIQDTRRVLREVADALAYASARGVVHRDIKPDNILLDADSGRAMVTDFGIARAIQDSSDARLTATGVAIGTPAYMSPEQAAGDRELDGRSDLYSLGIVAYQMLAGVLPFNATNTPTMLMKHLTERPAPVSHHRLDCPPDLGAIVMTLLEKEPDRRFASATALNRALEGDADAYPRTLTAVGTDVQGSFAGVATAGYGAVPTGGFALGAPAAGGLVSNRPGEPASVGATAAGDDLARWNAAIVQKFRRKLATFAAVNAPIVVSAPFVDIDLLGISVFWSMYIAMRYSKLWSAGYDWRDVFRQSRDRRLVDVATETVDEVRGVFDRSKVRVLKPRPLAAPLPSVLRPHSSLDVSPSSPLALPPPSPRPPSRPPGAAPNAALFGRHADAVRHAETDRAEVSLFVESLSKADKERLGELAPAADALYRRVLALASSSAELERAQMPGALRRVESKIAELEAEANPLDHTASEARVRRLATLRRERRSLVDSERGSAEHARKLESCVLALQNMRLDVIRLRASGVVPSPERITQLTERARWLSEDVDSAISVADYSASAADITRGPSGSE